MFNQKMKSKSILNNITDILNKYTESKFFQHYGYLTVWGPAILIGWIVIIVELIERLF